MTAPGLGPFLFDTSAESWFARTSEPRAAKWWSDYLGTHLASVSSVTMVERTRGYAMLWRAASPARRAMIESARIEYWNAARNVLPIDTATAIVAGEIMAMMPEPPTPPKRSHRIAESKTERLARWRFDVMIAATAMVSGLTLVHNNPGDFEAIRGRIENDPGRFPRAGSLDLIRCTAIAG